MQHMALPMTGCHTDIHKRHVSLHMSPGVSSWSMGGKSRTSILGVKVFCGACVCLRLVRKSRSLVYKHRRAKTARRCGGGKVWNEVRMKLKGRRRRLGNQKAVSYLIEKLKNVSTGEGWTSISRARILERLVSSPKGLGWVRVQTTRQWDFLLIQLYNAFTSTHTHTHAQSRDLSTAHTCTLSTLTAIHVSFSESQKTKPLFRLLAHSASTQLYSDSPAPRLQAESMPWKKHHSQTSGYVTRVDVYCVIVCH